MMSITKVLVACALLVTVASRECYFCNYIESYTFGEEDITSAIATNLSKLLNYY